MFSQNDFDILANNFNDVFNTVQREVRTAVKQANEAQARKLRETDNVPMNIILEEDGSNTIEVAIPGKTREDVKVKGIKKDGVDYISIEVVEPELTEAEQEAQDKRKYATHRMKSGAIYKEIEIPSTLDMTLTEVIVANGLLTIKIPVVESAKPIEFEIK